MQLSSVFEAWDVLALLCCKVERCRKISETERVSYFSSVSTGHLSSSLYKPENSSRTTTRCWFRLRLCCIVLSILFYCTLPLGPHLQGTNPTPSLHCIDILRNTEYCSCNLRASFRSGHFYIQSLAPDAFDFFSVISSQQLTVHANDCMHSLQTEGGTLSPNAAAAATPTPSRIGPPIDRQKVAQVAPAQSVACGDSLLAAACRQ